jgi:hypothetical protein
MYHVIWTINDIDITREILTQTVEPANTLVVAMDSYRYCFREVGCHSPAYLMVRHPEMICSSSIKVYAMHDRWTVLLDNIPMEKYSRFVISPALQHWVVEDYLWKMFPEGNVSMITIKQPELYRRSQ